MSGDDNKMDQFDSLFLSIAQHHPQGASQLLDTFVNFLSRKTDFFTGGKEGDWEMLVMSTFRKYEKIAREEHEKELRERKEREARARAKKAAEEQVKSAEITELTDAEAEKLQKEIDNEKRGITTPAVPAPTSKTIEDDEEESEKGISHIILIWHSSGLKLLLY
nr:unnamed protein product [Callosobruchus chinensis]